MANANISKANELEIKKNKHVANSEKSYVGNDIEIANTKNIPKANKNELENANIVTANNIELRKDIGVAKHMEIAQTNNLAATNIESIENIDVAKHIKLAKRNLDMFGIQQNNTAPSKILRRILVILEEISPSITKKVSSTKENLSFIQ